MQVFKGELGGNRPVRVKVNGKGKGKLGKIAYEENEHNHESDGEKDELDLSKTIRDLIERWIV